MQYFDIATIKQSIEKLQNYSANWLLPAFVFAANDVGTDALIDMSKRLGTDQFLDRYFNGVDGHPNDATDGHLNDATKHERFSLGRPRLVTFL
jgi:hypothetical protein